MIRRAAAFAWQMIVGTAGLIIFPILFLVVGALLAFSPDED